jgi:phosphoserine aminotransferase
VRRDEAALPRCAGLAGKARLGELIERSRALLGVPADYRMAVVPASDAGAVEMAMWNLLGPRGVMCVPTTYNSVTAQSLF